MDLIAVLIILVKALVLFVAMLLSVPVMVVLERKIIGRMQQRPGPNRVGVYAIWNALRGGEKKGGVINKLAMTAFRNGELQAIVEGVKLLLKEDFIPPKADRALFMIAPMLAVIPAFLVMTIVPLGPEFTFTLGGVERTISLGLAELPIGILFYFALTSVGVYGVVIAGWASNSKYSLLGGIRSTAQLLSYEISLGLSLIGVLLIVGSFQLGDMIESQAGGFWNWHIFRQPLAFLLFLIGGFAETNRLPFDLPEGESELGGGFHTEYSSLRFAMFFLAEYLHVLNFSSILVTLFLGGYQGPIALDVPPWLGVISGLVFFLAKIFCVFFFFVWVRGTLPRLRYDQLMDLGWKIMFPLAVVNVLATAGVIAAGLAPAATAVALFLVGTALIVIVDRLAQAAKRRVLGHAA